MCYGILVCHKHSIGVLWEFGGEQSDQKAGNALTGPEIALSCERALCMEFPASAAPCLRCMCLCHLPYCPADLAAGCSCVAETPKSAGMGHPHFLPGQGRMTRPCLVLSPQPLFKSWSEAASALLKPLCGCSSRQQRSPCHLWCLPMS